MRKRGAVCKPLVKSFANSTPTPKSKLTVEPTLQSLLSPQETAGRPRGS